MACTDEQRVLFETYMLSEEVECWWENTRQRMEVAGTTITWVNFKSEFIEKYFPANVCS